MPRLRALLGLLALGLLIGSCVMNDGPTAVGDDALVRLAIQPALIPSAADGSALPIHRIRTVVARQADGVVLREQRFDVLPTDASWTIDVDVPASGEPTVIVYLYLINLTGETETVQFSGRTPPISVTPGERVTGVDADIVRGPLSNLAVTSVTIASAPTALAVGGTASLVATVTASGTATPDLFWTSLDPLVLTLADSVATGVSVGTAEVVASAGAFADTVSIDVYVQAVDSVQVSPDSADVQAGATRTYTVQLFDAQGAVLTGRPVTWTTGSSAIATVSSTGVVTGVASGTTTVRATSEGVFDDAIVRVTAAPTGGGATIRWTRNGNGNWSDPTAWNLGRAPQAGDTVRIEQGNDYLVTLDVDATIARLVIGGTTDVIYLGVGDRTLTITGTGVGDELDIHPFGGVEIDNGSIRVSDVRNDGSIHAFGTPSTLEAATIVNNGRIVGVSDAILMISHPTATDFQTFGTLTVESGGTIMLGPNTDMTYQGGTIEDTGVLFFQPGSSMLLTSNLSIDGPILVLSDASVLEDDTEDLTIGPTSALEMLSTSGVAEVEGTLVVNGALISSGSNSRVGDLTVGATGTVYVDGGAVGGDLTTRAVDNSGTIALAGASEARFGPGNASASITNRVGGAIQLTPGGDRVLNGQLINQGDVTVGAPSELRRVDAQGAHVTASHVNVNTGTIELIAGGSLDIALGGASPTFTNSGTITVGTSTTLSVINLASPAGAIIATATAVLQGSGTVDVRSGIPTGINNGTIAPGLSPGALSWLGSVPMGPTGRIAIELEGTTPGTGYDQLNTSFQLILNGNGTLDVTAPGFDPALGDRFAVLTFASRLGNFAAVNLPSVPGVTLDTVWATAGTVDTLFIEAGAEVAPPNLNRWINTSGGTWSTAANWSKNAAPVPSDSVEINLAGIYTVTLDVNPTVQNLMIGGNSGEQTLSASVARTLTLGGASAVRANGVLSLTSSTINGTGSLTNQGTTSLVAGTVAVPIANADQLVVQRAVSFTGALTTLAGSVLRVQAPSGFTTALTVTDGWTNTGTIELTDAVGNTSNLTVTNGTLVNQGAINVLAGAGGGRTITAAVNNQGTVTVSTPVTINGANRIHTNSGTIAVTGGALTLTQSGTGSFTNQLGGVVTLTNNWAVSGGVLDLSAGSVSGAGVLSVTSSTLDYVAASLPGRMSLNGGTVTGGLTIPNAQTLTLQTSNFASPVTVATGGTLVIQQAVTIGGALLTPGTLRVLAPSGFTSALTVTDGWTNTGTVELTDAVGNQSTLTVTNGTLVNQGAINVLAGAGGVRTITAALDNEGTLTVSTPLTLNGADRIHANSGTIALTGGALTLSQSGTGSFTNETGGTVTLTNNWTVTGGVLNLSAGSVSGAALLSVTSATLNYVFASLPPRMSLNGGTVTGGLTIPVSQTLTLQTSNFASPVTVAVGGTLVIQQVVTLGGALLTPGTLRVNAPSGFTSALTVTDGWTNTGTVELTDAVGNQSTLTVTNGTLVNQGAINVLAGAGGVRTITAALVDNSGTMTVSRSLTLTGALNQQNLAVATVAASQTLAISGALTLNTGSNTTVSGTLTHGGCTNNGGTFSGFACP